MIRCWKLVSSIATGLICLMVVSLCVGAFDADIHKDITTEALSFLKPAVLDQINSMHWSQDLLHFSEPERHCDDCRFSEFSKYVQAQYDNVLGLLDPKNLQSAKAASEFGDLLHAVQDFYAHSNWVDLGMNRILDEGLQAWATLSAWKPTAGIIVVEGAIPQGWTVTNNTVNPNGVDVVEGGKPPVHGLISGTWRKTACPAPVARTHAQLNKDSEDSAARTDFDAARALACLQTMHEWCRLCRLVEAKYPNSGLAGLLAGWVDGASIDSAKAICGFCRTYVYIKDSGVWCGDAASEPRWTPVSPVYCTYIRTIDDKVWHGTGTAWEEIACIPGTYIHTADGQMWYAQRTGMTAPYWSSVAPVGCSYIHTADDKVWHGTGSLWQEIEPVIWSYVMTASGELLQARGSGWTHVAPMSGQRIQTIDGAWWYGLPIGWVPEVGQSPCGDDPPIYGDIMVFPTPERFLNVDLNGDGDMGDTVLRYKNLSTGAVVNTGLECSGADHGLDIWENLIVFSAPSSQAIMIYDLRTGAVLDTGSVGHHPSIHSGWVAFTALDRTMGLFEVATGRTVATGIVGSYPAIHDGVVAFESGSPRTIWYYDIVAGTAHDIGSLGARPAIYDNLIVFSTSEREYGCDLNSDGDSGEHVLRYYDLATGATLNTGIDGEWPAVFGNTVVFATAEAANRADLNGDGRISGSVIQVLDLPSGRVANTGQLGSVPDIYEGTISFHALEMWSGLDWSGDGDLLDSVVLTYALPPISDAPGIWAAVSEEPSPEVRLP